MFICISFLLSFLKLHPDNILNYSQIYQPLTLFLQANSLFHIPFLSFIISSIPRVLLYFISPFAVAVTSITCSWI